MAFLTNPILLVIYHKLNLIYVRVEVRHEQEVRDMAHRFGVEVRLAMPEDVENIRDLEAEMDFDDEDVAMVWEDNQTGIELTIKDW